MRLFTSLDGIVFFMLLLPRDGRCGIQRNPAKDTLDEDILDLRGDILKIQRQILQDRRDKDRLVLQLNRTIFQCFEKCEKNEIAQNDKTNRAVQKGFQEEKRMRIMIMSEIASLKKDNTHLNTKLQEMTEDQNITKMEIATVKTEIQHLTTALQYLKDDGSKQKELITEMQNLKQENQHLNLSLKSLQEEAKAKISDMIEIFSKIELIKQDDTNFSNILTESMTKIVKEVVKELNETKKRVPVNGAWSLWESWSTCSSSCGNGLGHRTRTCTNPVPAIGGQYCDGQSIEYSNCRIQSCEVHGGWSIWSNWGLCSVTCGMGLTNRRRNCDNPTPSHDGSMCFGDPIEYNLCTMSTCAVNGDWTAWGSWTSCTYTCGKGISHRTRTCTNPTPAIGGDYCVGDASQYNDCQIISCTVNGGWTLWSSWSTCSSSCGNGLGHRTRTCTNPVPANGGQYCDGQPIEYSSCQNQSCVVNGGWTSWSSWSTCISSMACGVGMQHMTRTCTSPRPTNGGVYCDGNPISYRDCASYDNCGARIVSGRLEVKHKGVWGTVCDDGFSAEEAKVACRMMGYSGTTASVLESSFVPDGTDPIWLDDVACVGTESSLFECSYYEHGVGRHNCHHAEDVGVSC